MPSDRPIMITAAAPPLPCRLSERGNVFALTSELDPDRNVDSTADGRHLLTHPVGCSLGHDCTRCRFITIRGSYVELNQSKTGVTHFYCDGYRL